MSILPVTLKATEIQVGDRTNISGKSRVIKKHERNGMVLLAIATRGARSNTVIQYSVDEMVTIWRA